MEQCQNAGFLVILRDCCTTKKKIMCHVIDVHVFKKIDILVLLLTPTLIFFVFLFSARSVAHSLALSLSFPVLLCVRFYFDSLCQFITLYIYIYIRNAILLKDFVRF